MVFKLSDHLAHIERDGGFSQTQFANTVMPSSLCYVGKERYLNQANNNPNISCLVVPEVLAPKVSLDKGCAVENRPEQAFYQFHNYAYLSGKMAPNMLFMKSKDATIHPTAVVSNRTYIGARVKIGAHAVIEDYCYIGNDVVIESSAIIGSSGHYYKQYGGRLFRVEHAGGVWLESGVQVLAGAVISKSLHADFTIVGKDTVVSINAHVGHGCKVGERCTITGNVQVSGYTTIGNNVWIGPSSTIGNLLTIGDNSRIEIGSVVIQDLPPNSRVSGNFALNHKLNVREYTYKKRMDNGR